MESEKIYCNGTDPATLAALMNNNGNAAEMAMLANQNNMQNPMWIIWLLALRWMNGYGEGANSEIESLRGQIADNKNSSDMLMALQNNSAAMQDIANRTNTNIDFVRQSICSLEKGIAEVGGMVGMTGERVINSVLLGNKDITSMMQNCCCENKQLVMSMGYEGQLRDQSNTAAINSNIENARQAIVNGFAQSGYAAAQNTCDIKETIVAGNQRIIDTLNAHWNQEQALALQDTKFKLSQVEQNQYLISQLKSGCGCGCN